MIGILGLHGFSQHPELIGEFTNRLAPQQPGCSPRGTFVDGEGFTFFKGDRIAPYLTKNLWLSPGRAYLPTVSCSLAA